jgi:hypothetical protein
MKSRSSLCTYLTTILARQRLGKHVPTKMNKQATKGGLLEAVITVTTMLTYDKTH